MKRGQLDTSKRSSNPVATAEISLDDMFGPKFSGPGGRYSSTENADGTWNIHRVPFFADHKMTEEEGGHDVDANWQIKALALHQRRFEDNGFLQPLIINHHAVFGDVFAGGFFLPTEVDYVQLEGKEVAATFCDLLYIRADVYAAFRRGRLPYLSPEFSYAKYEHAHLSALDTESPWFKFPHVTVGQERRYLGADLIPGLPQTAPALAVRAGAQLALAIRRAYSRKPVPTKTAPSKNLKVNKQASELELAVRQAPAVKEKPKGKDVEDNDEQDESENGAGVRSEDQGDNSKVSGDVGAGEEKPTNQRKAPPADDGQEGDTPAESPADDENGEGQEGIEDPSMQEPRFDMEKIINQLAQGQAENNKQLAAIVKHLGLSIPGDNEPGEQRKAGDKLAQRGAAKPAAAKPGAAAPAPTNTEEDSEISPKLAQRLASQQAELDALRTETQKRSKAEAKDLAIRNGARELTALGINNAEAVLTEAFDNYGGETGVKAYVESAKRHAQAAPPSNWDGEMNLANVKDQPEVEAYASRGAEALNLARRSAKLYEHGRERGWLGAKATLASYLEKVNGLGPVKKA